MGVKCKIFIHQQREGQPHKSGSLLKGVVQYTINKPTEFQNVTLSLLGRAKAKWTEDYGRSSTTYTGTHELITQEVNVTNKEPEQTVTLHGVYEYPFSFYLPENLPTSYKDKTGKIIYSIHMKFEKKSFFSFNKEFTEEFLVRGSIDPTPTIGEENYTGPVTFGLQKKIFAPFAKNKPLVKLEAEIAKTCLIPGEQIKLSYVVTKPVQMIIQSVTADLYCYTTYKCGSHSKKKVVRVQGCSGATAGVRQGEEGNLTCVVPTRPELFSLQNCGVISKEYWLRVKVLLPMPHRNAVVEMPVVLGERKTLDPELQDYLSHLVDDAPLPSAPPAYYEYE